MTTINQLIRKKRQQPSKKTKYFLFQGRPHKAVKCLTTLKIMSPRKPNSAKRKFVRVGWYQSRGFFFSRKQVSVNAYVPGEIKSPDFGPQKNMDLLIRGGRVKDLPGMKYTIVRGHKKSLKGLSYRRQSRSKYGHIRIIDSNNDNELNLVKPSYKKLYYQ